METHSRDQQNIIIAIIILSYICLTNLSMQFYECCDGPIKIMQWELIFEKSLTSPTKCFTSTIFFELAYTNYSDTGSAPRARFQCVINAVNTS